MLTQRQQRVNSLLQREISDILRSKVEDPRIGFITVTGVDVSTDLRHATVNVSVLGDAEAKRQTLRALIRARSFIRNHLGNRLDLRRVPQLTIHIDDTAERAQRMEQLLRGVAEEASDPDDHDGE